MRKVDLNADMGESFGMYKLGHDEEFMEYITSANVACGFHAGDYSVMNITVKLAKKYNVQVGAHPGLPDLQGFGRREMKLTAEEVYDIVVYQVGALKAFAEAAGVRLHHVKPHGSLYGMAHRMEDVAQAICQAVKDIDSNMYLYIMKKGVIAPMAESMGLKSVYELYSDLGYDAQGNLVITRAHDAHEPDPVAERVRRMVIDNKVKAMDGTEVSIEGNSVCVHCDTPGAFDIVKAVRAALEKAGCDLASPEM
ncbi:Lactam utilization protein LamB [Olavius sp. associated proteobacterium Delta 1]|nr:Lactam utilization protein LamB [Olavius sp. associated proteobacterium Delta 1]